MAHAAPEANDATWAVGWSIAIAVIGYVWSLWLYRRHAAPSIAGRGRYWVTSDDVSEARDAFH